MRSYEKYGTLNADTPDLSELATCQRREHVGHCDSNWCSDGQGKLVPIPEAVENRHDNCPRCGRMLVWRVKRNTYEATEIPHWAK